MHFDIEFNVSNQRFEPSISGAQGTIKIPFSETQTAFESSFDKVQTATKLVGDPYKGEYKVTPKVTEQTLPTKEKIMLDDVTVKSIPSYNVSNTVGGTTFYIATMDE